MRRAIGIGLASAALVVTLGTTAVAAPLNPFSVKVSRNVRPGGTLEVRVIESSRRGNRSVKYRASTVVHYASGDVGASLSPNGRSFVSSADVPVGVNETPGVVGVDVTVSANGTTLVIHGFTNIKSVKRSR
jgi:hypothetical protein